MRSEALETLPDCGHLHGTGTPEGFSKTPNAA